MYESAIVRELDRRAMAAGTSAEHLMRRAAAAAWQAARERWPAARRVVVLCGSGNNGGDGYGVASLARAAGCTVQLIQVGATPASTSARALVTAWQAEGGTVTPWPAPIEAGADLVIDAVLGIGLSRPVAGDPFDAIAAINAQSAPVMALDVPSGLSADTGRPLATAVRADLTVSFIADKAGLWTGRAVEFTGERRLDTLEVPPTLAQDLRVQAWRLPPRLTQEQLPPRRAGAHKGDHGHVLVVGGAPGMAGAALLAARAALRGGAGWVSVATHPLHATALVAAQPELMVHAVGSADDLQPLLRKSRVVVLGPGLGQDAWACALHDAALASGRPLVIDADALNLLARRPQTLGGAVLTPHPGEAARLLGEPNADRVEADRYGAARRLQARFGAVVVLKGAGTVVADDMRLAVCAAGNPGMAVGGMGDVLAGLIGALMAQGRAPAQAAACGVQAHALAADRVATARGARGLLPTDVIDALSEPLNLV